MKFFQYYLVAYLFDYPALIIHEASHYVVAVLFYLFGKSYLFPRFVFKRHYSITEDGNGLNVKQAHAYVTIFTPSDMELRLVALAPAITVTAMLVCGLLYSTELLLFTLCKLEILWLSQGDIGNIKHGKKWKNNV